MTYMGKQTRGELYAAFSDEELLSILREAAGRLGRNPSKKEVFCVYRIFLIERFGNWPKAGGCGAEEATPGAPGGQSVPEC